MDTIFTSGNFIWMAGTRLDRLLEQRSALHRLRPPDPTGREGARHGKRLGSKWEAGSPVAAVYDRRFLVGACLQAISSRNRERARSYKNPAVYDRRVGAQLVCARSIVLRFGRTQGAPLRRKIGPTPVGGHRPPLQNTVWVQRDSTGSGCLRLLKQRSALRKPDSSFGFPPQRGGLRSLSGGVVCSTAEATNWLRPLSPNPTNS
jgi:hypothetical protein